VHSRIVVVPTVVVREVLVERSGLKLDSEEIDFVEEEDDGGFEEPARVGDGFEEDQGFL